MERITGRNIYFTTDIPQMHTTASKDTVLPYRQQRYNRLSFILGQPCQAGSCSNGSSRRDADQQSLILRQFAARTYGVIIGYLQNFVYYGTVIVLRHKSGTDTLYFMGTGLPTGKYGENLQAPQPQSLPSGYWLSRLHPHHSLCLPSLHRPRKYPPGRLYHARFLVR